MFDFFRPIFWSDGIFRVTLSLLYRQNQKTEIVNIRLSTRAQVKASRGILSVKRHNRIEDHRIEILHTTLLVYHRVAS